MKRMILLAFLCTTTLVMAQRINHVQEAIANYDYEAALTLIAKEKPTPTLAEGKAQAGTWDEHRSTFHLSGNHSQ